MTNARGRPRSCPPVSRRAVSGRDLDGLALDIRQDVRRQAAAVRAAASVSLWIGAGTPELGAERSPSSRNVRFRADFFGCTPDSRRGADDPSWSLVDPQQKSRLTNS